jgi:hypothetical protein
MHEFMNGRTRLLVGSCGLLTHTLSTRDLRLLTQRFATRIIRGSPAPFAFDTLSRVRFFSTLPHCTTGIGKKILEKQKSSQIFIVSHNLTGGQ